MSSVKGSQQSVSQQSVFAPFSKQSEIETVSQSVSESISKPIVEPKHPAVDDENNPHDLLPKGNWTKQLKDIPATFGSASIDRYYNLSQSMKHNRKGYKLFKAHRVSNVFISPQQSTIFVKSVVRASYSCGKLYHAHIVLNKMNGTVISGKCKCKAGLGGVCCHIAAILWFILDCVFQNFKFIPQDLSCTERTQAWGKLKVKNKNLSTPHFSSLKFKKHQLVEKTSRRSRKDCIQSYKCLSPESTMKGKSNPRMKELADKLQSAKIRPFWQKLMAEQNYESVTFKPLNYGEIVVIDEPSPAIERISLPVRVIQVDNEDNEIPDICKVSEEEATAIEEATRGQSQSQLWSLERSKRLTASKFGKIVKRKKVVTAEFLKDIKGGKSISHMKYVKEGIKNEPVALKKYCSLKKCVAYKVGLVINAGFPMIGASPDSVIYDEEIKEFGLLEIKTLSRAKELSLTIEEILTKKEIKTFLQKDLLGKIFVNRNHDYYYQVQGQMGVTGLPWCDLFADTGVDHFCERIAFDPDLFFKVMLPKLSEFYFNHFYNNGDNN